MIKPRVGAGVLTTAIGFVLSIGFSVGPVSSVALAEPDAGVGEAERHFQDGVALYLEADYRGALVEFTRAYTLSPNGVVLFNIGETEYQLRDYAAALETFQRYLFEAPADDKHRPIAEHNIKELRTRVAHLRVVTVPPGAMVSINDRVVGESPLQKPIAVGAGRLTLRAALPGRPAIERPIDVAGEDDVLVTMEVPRSPALPASSALAGDSMVVDTSTRPPASSSTLRRAGWVATGILAGGAVTFGLLARSESNDLQQVRQQFPTTADAIDHVANRTKTFSIIADSLTAAALVVGGITLYSTVTANPQSSSAQLTVGFGTLRLDGRF
jgi:tetratricopeptide (TPR) repeat protein